jgi:hypothetical protein
MFSFRSIHIKYCHWYLGMAHPFTMPFAVGGYDIPNVDRWRRPENDSIPYPRVHWQSWMPECNPGHSAIGPACTVKLFDVTRSLPQRIEGQFRRHWGFAPAIWNLYFRVFSRTNKMLNQRAWFTRCGYLTARARLLRAKPHWPSGFRSRASDSNPRLMPSEHCHRPGC